ncbi:MULTISPECIES: Fe2+-dependent dioxygenase [Prochlorococcus]|uniref:PKHD-type hydroxylase Pro_1271 n=1 Tax=Prochlorococcus marinus (strain SARG / CCMP1375 / SS120) TaxID=167539 RepID=Y1271_PROMA|nr:MULTISPECIES: Fe2+-dependent dioxygenase [Prochlorococcus]Q7VB29.1 RecName: Full=PKHD-type hydroxylase Pro_1271 [Prochlorococcus marinus subsp. marinus str. CCMP1375]AAQ00315.1 2OG-Fe(II) oxygenase superfamily enzyme [Prochlorococcus marinus subsp. marinus str. CCMP1375]KGG10171.1 Iron-uptake factor PiuC [Prochlorococcus marinus str. LG]KGG22236.1 Iron-uptake factor PiuC [Prochlorococcus marinus str. SS2]KGG24447.1 Iron-uptake factor PiuC [Prochlorococcus marinus str. SS35]KGG33342.1 Iron-
MDYLTHKLLDPTRAKSCIQSIQRDQSLWKDGKSTAGLYASKVKNNLQLDKKSKVSIDNSNLIIKAIISDLLVKSFTIPRKVHGVMFSKSSKGNSYGMHLDNAYMSTGRSDLSFTLFLSDPGEYEGGELAIETIQETRKIKLPQGHIIIYPSTTLHSVEEVTSGTRIVCVGWIQSYIPNNEDRKILFSLDAGAKGLLAAHGQSHELDLVFQSYNNLLRRLGG